MVGSMKDLHHKCTQTKHLINWMLGVCNSEMVVIHLASGCTAPSVYF